MFSSKKDEPYKQKLMHALKLILPPVIFILLLLLLLQLLADSGIIKSFVLPAPSAVFHSLTADMPLFGPHILQTLKIALLGFVLSMIVGMLFALLMFRFKNVYRIFYPLVVASQTIPTMVITPVIVLILGYSDLPRLFVVVLTCFFPITISLFRGLRSVDSDLLRLMQTMGAGSWDTMRHVLLPASMPQLFSGLRISATYSVMSAVLAEWSGGGDGLGILMLRSKRSFRFDRMFAAVILIIVLSLAFYGTVILLERIMMPWQHSLKQKRKNAGGKVLALLLILLLLPLPACGKAPDGVEELQELTFALDWTPNTNHSGLYLAQERGYYAEEGLNITFRESDMNFIEMVANGTAAFGIASQEQVLQARASSAKIPVVAIAALLQHNTSGFASAADRGIESPQDFEGHIYSGWGTELELAFIRSLMEKSNADYGQVEIINQSASNFIASMETEADFAWIYYGWDGVNCELQDYPINFILLGDIDERLDFYSPVLITSDELIESDHELVERFLRATRRGYLDAIADADAAVAALMKAAPELDPVLLLASQEWLNNESEKSSEAWGSMLAERWENFALWMSENNLLEEDLDVNAAYSNEFLPEE